MNTPPVNITNNATYSAARMPKPSSVTSARGSRRHRRERRSIRVFENPSARPPVLPMAGMRSGSRGCQTTYSFRELMPIRPTETSSQRVTDSHMACIDLHSYRR